MNDKCGVKYRLALLIARYRLGIIDAAQVSVEAIQELVRDREFFDLVHLFDFDGLQSQEVIE